MGGDDEAISGTMINKALPLRMDNFSKVEVVEGAYEELSSEWATYPLVEEDDDEGVEDIRNRLLLAPNLDHPLPCCSLME